jgi:UDPglucose 6-dehydrogenase
MRIAVVGTGYVGLVTGACLAETGNHVVCIDNDVAKVGRLIEGEVPFYEPGLPEMVASNRDAGRLEFTTELEPAVRAVEVIFVAVGTPPLPDGGADLSAVDDVVRAVAHAMNGPRIVVMKSTVPVGTGARVEALLGKSATHPFTVVSNPEFLKEGAAIEDFMKPDRVVVGVNPGDGAEHAIAVMRQIYAPFMRRRDRLIVMGRESAEMTKYASNAMLATRISFMNELAGLCERVGANVEAVRQGMALDTRIGTHFLFPGVGFGGSCFPKDLHALQHTAGENGLRLRLLEAVTAVNADQKLVLVEKVKSHFDGALDGRTFALWGLAFKPGTDDMREAPAIDIVRGLVEAGAKVRAHDPEAMETARSMLDGDVELGDDPYSILENADGLLLATEWNSYRSPDFGTIARKLRTKVVFDGRNVWDRRLVEGYGLAYHGIGI